MSMGIDELREGCSPQFELELPAPEDGGRIGCSPLVRVSTRARRLSIRVYPDARVEVVAPRRVPPRDIERFVAAHREWIDDKRAQALRNRPPPQVFPPPALELGLSGECFRLQLAGGTGRPRIT